MHQGMQHSSNGVPQPPRMSSNMKQKVRQDIREELSRSHLEAPPAACAVTQRSESVLFGAPGPSLPPSLSSLLPERDPDCCRQARDEVSRLDARLREAAARERRVKRDRAVLEMRMRTELDQLNASGDRYSEEATNTAKFLALMDSDRGRRVRSDEAELEGWHAPVFQTECPELELAGTGGDDRADVSEDRSRLKTAAADGRVPGGRQASLALLGTGKDFVSRNIILAAAARADAAVPMTPDERARLADLLAQDDAIDADSQDDDEDGDSWRLREIDRRLAALSGSGGDGDGGDVRDDQSGGPGPGDPALAAVRAERRMAKRLAGLEGRLASLRSGAEPP